MNKKKVALFGCALPLAAVISLSTCAGIVAAINDESNKTASVADFTVTSSPSTSTLSDADKARIKANEEAEAKRKAEEQAQAEAEAKKAAEDAEKAKKEAESKAQLQNDDETADLMLQLVWDQQKKSDQDLMCAGFALDADQMWDSFLVGAGDDFVTRDQWERFMNKAC